MLVFFMAKDIINSFVSKNAQCNNILLSDQKRASSIPSLF